MIAGAIRFRTFGAFAGFFIGIFIEELIEGNSSLFGSNEKENNEQEHQLSDYQNQLIVLIASLLKTNNLISKEQSYYILKYFYRQFGTEKGKFLFKKLQDLINVPLDYKAAAESLAGTQREGKLQIINFLYGITKVNRPMHAEEKKVLERIAMSIGMAKYDFETIIADNQSQRKAYVHIPFIPASHTHYKTLGVSEQASTQELKKAYRSLVLKFHPDKTKLPRELAASKFQEVQEAYDAIRSFKGIK